MSTSFESLILSFGKNVVQNVATSALEDLGSTTPKRVTKREQYSDASIFDTTKTTTDDSACEDAYENAGKIIGGVVGSGAGCGIIGSFIGGILGKIAYSTVGKTMNQISDKLLGWIPGYDQIKNFGYNIFNTVANVASLGTGGASQGVGNLASKLIDVVA